MIARRSIHSECVSNAPQQRAGITLITVLAVFVALGLLAALLLPSVTRSREAARRTQCKCHLKQIGLALHNYHDTYGEFPPAFTVDADGRPLHSWRTLILPFVDQVALYQSIDLSKPWDDPANAEAFKAHPTVFRCPSDPGQSGHTVYLAVATTESCLRAAESRSVKTITDGTSNTLMVIEAPFKKSVLWMSTQDADEALIRESFRPENKETQHAGGGHALLVDGTVRFLSRNIAADTLTALITTQGGETVGEF